MSSITDPRWNEVCRASQLMEENNDCVVKVLALTTNMLYEHAWGICSAHGRKRGAGMYPKDWHAMFKARGYELRVVPPQRYNNARTGVTLARQTHMRGKFIVWYKAHVGALVNGVLLDWTNGRKKRVYEVYEVVKL